MLARLATKGGDVFPIYIASGCLWEEAELESLRDFLAAVHLPTLAPLTVLQLPLADVYGDHWSLTGRGTPSSRSADEAVYLPGRNVLLVVKAALWCQTRGVERLALGVLGTSPFNDARPQFLCRYADVLSSATGQTLRIETPLAGVDKAQVMAWGADLPLQHTFSCLAPVGRQHCGRCNKCAERRKAFAVAGRADPTKYAHA